ncbi:hypothetical protein CE91St46_18900 [Eubacteriales bacterium]|nr:ATP-binding protein [Faecalicatena sp. BF-R-105]GKH50779.1 hypothetical protein CE91St46_18900 [Eubacteriales bacterium]GKH63500.1 hypothetical protein CE91St47_19690 [Eubacteriales bacterium]
MSISTLLPEVCAAAYASLLRYANTRKGIRSTAEKLNLTSFLTDSQAQRTTEQQERAVLERARAETPAARYAQLISALENAPGGVLAVRGLELAILAYVTPSVLRLVAPLQNTPDCSGISLELTGLIAYDEPEHMLAHLGEYLAAAHRLSPYLFSLDSPLPACRRSLNVDERLMSYLCGEDQFSDLLQGCAVLSMPEQKLPALFCADGPLLDQLRCELSSTPGFVHLKGPNGSGKRLHLRWAAQQLGRPLVLADVRSLVGRDAQAARKTYFEICREALFYHAILCWFHADSQTFDLLSVTLEEFVRRTASFCAQHTLSLCFCTDSQTEMGAVLSPLSRIAMPENSRMRRIQLWRGFCAQAKISVDCERFGAQYRLQPAEIEQAVRQIAHRAALGVQISNHLVARTCLEVLPPPAQGSIRRIETPVTLNDLKLPSEQKQNLLQLCAHVWQRHRVYDQWDMESRYPYGRNVSALFVGPPGTGKTMAAHVLANLLDIPLYQINLSQVVDKYIGETEKRLEEIFNIAEKCNSILFFDEADSIFGKRSEINDAKDKYANTEVSYILQRIEQYDGIVVLATNYKKNIDEAFMRRMRYLIEFTLPGESLRGEIWRSAFAPQVPLDGVDFEYLARQFELSGGSIKNIVLNASFLAANENAPVGMRHILSCVRNENAKVGKTMLKQDFAEYSILI